MPEHHLFEGNVRTQPHIRERLHPPHSANLSLRVTKTQKGLSKFSFVVSKKVSKSAVVRNLLRRRGYSALQSALDREKISTGGFLGAFFFKKGADKLDFKSIQSEVVFLLKKGGIT